MKDLGYYLNLPYTFEVVREDETTWFAQVRELPGCMTEGDSPADAMAMLQDALATWLEAALESAMVIPEPRPEEEYSGKFNVRMSRSLHRDLVQAAAREDVSLNQYVVTELARAVGAGQNRRDAASRPAASAESGAFVRWVEPLPASK